MSHSQNGWTAGTAKAIGGLDSSAVPGTKITLPQGVRKGDVATVLLYVAEQFHLTVEPLHDGHCWGYDYRKIRGSETALSNHASGTAIDLNAPAHPLAEKGTFSAKQVAAIRKILKFCDGAVRWGGDFTGRKDEMHFEIVGTASDVALIAKKIQVAREPKPVRTTKIAEDGVLGSATIKRWQKIMGTTTNGHLDAALIKAVQRHLVKHGAKLTVDGEGLAQDGVKTKTIAALQKYLGVRASGVLTKRKSTTVVALQKRLNTGKF